MKTATFVPFFYLRILQNPSKDPAPLSGDLLRISTV